MQKKDPIPKKMPNIGEGIRRLRTAAKLSQDELGKKIDRTRGTISRIENNKVNCSLNMLAFIAEACEAELGGVFVQGNEFRKYPDVQQRAIHDVIQCYMERGEVEFLRLVSIVGVLKSEAVELKQEKLRLV